MAQDDTSTSCSAGDPLDLARSIIDRDIARLEESIRDLKSRRNELSPISRLPTEMLCNIFFLRVIEDSLNRSPKTWTNFSQVSQHWRSSALSAPGLWTNIPLSHPRWAQEMLKRSKMAKLTIRTDVSFASNPKNIETVKSCLSQMNRVEEINIIAIAALVLQEIFLDVPKSAPQLHTLCIGSHWSHLNGTAFSIREDFLYDTERLQRVELIKCKTSWDSQLLTGLTRLTLEDSLEANSSIIQFLHALQRMPALTDLHLKDSIPDDSGGLSTYPDVDLPCLRFLRISSGVGALTTALRHITFPHSAILRLTCKESQSIQIDFSNFLSVLATKFLSFLVIRRLSLQAFDGTQNLDGTQTLEFYLQTDAIIPRCFPYSQISARSQLQLVLTWPSSQFHSHVKALTRAFDAMSLPFVTHLQISTLDCIDSQTWVKTFRKLPLLKRVYVQSSATHSFFEALVYKTKAAEKSEAAYHNVSLPKLRCIQLVETDFGETSPISVDMLLDYLMERYDRNAEVQVLRLNDCYSMWLDEVERLEEIVVDVIWDGVEQELEVSTQYDSEEDRDGSDDYDEDEYDDFSWY